MRGEEKHAQRSCGRGDMLLTKNLKEGNVAQRKQGIDEAREGAWPPKCRLVEAILKSRAFVFRTAGSH